jgi:hypothetical protein
LRSPGPPSTALAGLAGEDDEGVVFGAFGAVQLAQVIELGVSQQGVCRTTEIPP